MRAWLIAALLALGVLAAGLLALPDPRYTLHELAVLGRFGSHDRLIAATARRHRVPPELVKAIVWQESRFRPHMAGRQGERGLMQVTEPAAREWAEAAQIEVFAPTDLFDPATNLNAGTWYLARALEHWKGRDHAIPFALAEYNAGRSRVKRWAGAEADAAGLIEAMDFPTTRAYIAAVLDRMAFYERRGDFRNRR